MEELPSPKTSDASVSPGGKASIELSFGLVNKAGKEFKILGVRDHDDNYNSPPAPHKIGDKAILTEGKFPLTDYTDIGKHRLTFTTNDGLKITGTLNGFSWQCAIDADPNLTRGHIVILLDA
jgi:hypothetical protein